MQFDTFFDKAVGVKPYPWQSRIAAEGLPEVLSIPTGLGKTEGVALGWAYRRIVAKSPNTPRHLVFCLPMRVLVRQTEERLVAAFGRLREAGLPNVGVHALMGGTRRDDQDAWLSHPEREWILIGTQDQLLSRALNRGYAVSPYEWPVHFAMLNNDCHWVLDEVQLMGPAVWASAQLDWMRRLRFGTMFPCSTTWMSATVGANFLDTRDRRDAQLSAPKPLEIGTADQDHPAANMRLLARRPIALHAPDVAATTRKGKASKRTKAGDGSAHGIASAIVASHDPGTLSLIVCNTVKAAQAIFGLLPNSIPRILITSRFRAGDRADAEETLASFERARKSAGGLPVPDSPGLICVSTQVIEAGVDVSARKLWSEIAPWASIVQRLGRLNRDGLDNDAARAVFFPAADGGESPGKGRIGPYSTDAIQAAGKLLSALIPLSEAMPARDALSAVRDGKLGELVLQALAAPPAPLPRAVDVHGLFTTERDVYGGFTDVSSFVRDADSNADVSVFWRDMKELRADDALEGPPFDVGEACPVPVHALRAFLATATAYVWDSDARDWQRLRPASLRPGMVVLLAGAAGGYRRDLGWTGEAFDRLQGLEAVGPGAGAYDDDARSESIKGWVPLHAHLRDAESQALRLVSSLGLDDILGDAVVKAAREHDIGKAHPQWHKTMGKPSGDATLWAKFPAEIDVAVNNGTTEGALIAWLSQHDRSPEILSRGTSLRIALNRRLTREERDHLRTELGVETRLVQLRPGMRHEAASALAMMSRYLMGQADFPALSIYLAAAHHGKVRTHLGARNRGGDDVCGVPRNSEPLPLDKPCALDFRCAADGADGAFTSDGFVLESPGWTAIVSDLLGPSRPARPWDTGTVPLNEPRNQGPFRLAYLEALVRIADWRASSTPSEVRCVR